MVETNGETWLICGGRTFTDEKAFTEELLNVVAERCGFPAMVVQGGATGADLLARSWAKRLELPCVTGDACWKRDGKAAGPIRNQRMLNEYEPSVVVAFPGGRGTADMIRRAKAMEIDVVEIPK